MPTSASHTPSVINIPQSSLTWQLPDYPGAGKTTLGRFMLESRLQFTSDTTENDFWLLAPVMACRVFGDMPVMQQPPYEYWAIFGDTHYHVMRTGEGASNTIADSTHRITDTFNWVHRHRVESLAQALTSTPAIIQAALAHHPLIARAVLPGDNGQWVVTFPIKHINVCADSGIFQCETGPVLIPQRDDPLTDQDPDMFFRSGMAVAYVAFNRLDRLEALVRTQEAGGRVFRQPSMTQADITLWALST